MLRGCDLDAELPEIERHYGPPHVAFIAEIGGISIGCVALARFSDTTAIVKRLYVVPEHRGVGVAKELMATLLATARKRGYTRIVLDTEREHLRHAYRFYLSLGFSECAPYAAVDYATPTFMELTL